MNAFRIIVATACASLLAVASTNGSASTPRRLSRGEIRQRCGQFSPAVAREVAGIQYLVRPEEMAALLAHPQDQRCQAWIDAWWDAHDPIYTTSKNEAREEHEYRVEVATEYFARGVWPGWDDRGEVYIRYGAPASHSYTPADVAPGGYIPAHNLWYYPKFDMCVRFEDPTGSGRYVLFLQHVHAGSRPRTRGLTPIDATASSFGDLLPPLPEKGYDDFMKRVYRYYDVIEKTPVVHSFDYASMRVPMRFAVHSFRGGDGVDRVDVNTEFESPVTPLPGETSPRRFVTTAVFWDDHGREIARHARTDSVGTSLPIDEPACTVLSQSVFTLPPGAYRVALTVEESGSGRFTSLRRDVRCGDMEIQPAMSDLALARSIGSVQDGSAFNRGALSVVPQPSATYQLGVSVPVYFEVYHLGRAPDGTYKYQVEYTITPGSPRPRGFWKELFGGDEDPLRVRAGFDAAALGPSDVVHVLANTQNLWPGEYALAVTVTDAASNRQVTRTTSFTLREP